MIRRSKRKDNFTMIPNNLLIDPELDWKDVGLLCYLLSKPDDWSVSVSHLAKQKKTGRDGVMAIIKRLRKAGYVLMKKLGSGEVEYVVHDEPKPDNPVQGQNRKIPERENPTLVKTDKTNKGLIVYLRTHEKYQVLSEEERSLFDEYIEMRKKKKLETTERIANRLLTKYHKFGRQQAVIEDAINANWRDFYPPRGNNNAAHKPVHKPNAAERMHETLKRIAREDTAEMGERVV